jgi:phosphoglycerol transferase MdoB-like AlkP superfamily enzyme
VILVVEFGNILFFIEFGNRLDSLVFEYLTNITEIYNMIMVSYSAKILLFASFSILISILFYRVLLAHIIYNKIVIKLLILPLVLLILFGGIRSSVGFSTPNQSFYTFSNNQTKNEIANNSIFSMFYSLYLRKKETSFDNMYDDTTNYLGRLKNKYKYNYTNANTFAHTQISNLPRKNLILVIAESFGKNHIGVLGGTPTTPNFDKMSRDGLFISNMYSSSNRSNRGIEAIFSSIFPISFDTYLKLDKSQKNFWTFTRELRKYSYSSTFLYGGDSKFDNIKGFLLANGIDKIIDKNSIKSNAKQYTWGYSDEEIYSIAIKELDNLNKRDKPFVLVIYTLSSHKPFDYPDNKINLYGDNKKNFPNSIKYADFALGEFYDKLQSDGYLKDTVLAIVADHNSQIKGDIKIPVNEFKIPALLISQNIKPKEIHFVTHQIDMAPTLLYAMGVSSSIPAMGVNLFKAKKSKALIFHKNAFAYLDNNGFTIYEANKKSISYNYDYEIIENSRRQTNEGLLYIHTTQQIYNKKLHY